MIYKTLHRKLKIEQHETLYNLIYLRTGRVSSSSSTNGTYRVTRLNIR